MFFINQEGDVLETPNSDHVYDGGNKAPAFDAAFSSESPGDMCASLAVSGATANDGQTWLVVGDSR